MKKQKLVLLTGILCAVSLMVCACGSKKYEPIEVIAPEVQPLDTEEDAEKETPVTEQDMENEETDTEADKEEAGSSAKQGNDENTADTEGAQENKSAAGGSPSTEEPKNTENISGTESVQENQPTLQSASSEWVDSTPNLEGDAKDVQAGQFTVVEAVKQNRIMVEIFMCQPAVAMIHHTTRLWLHMMKIPCLQLELSMTEGRDRSYWQQHLLPCLLGYKCRYGGHHQAED
ncbi:hypothetical protein [Enterocloster clostridioformis]|uniref:Lipoprotein n=1 Tax=Enterocloster clostridioformis TaxID=1531 RepID=A0A2X2U0T4_9FIRM|nr:hypothetical protein [Enterocloster clostridioformis]SQB10138.1 Uncharacterised protein [Enterocloster clostridioformis]